MTGSRLALGLLVGLTACADRVVVDQEGLIAGTDGAPTSASDDTGFEDGTADSGFDDSSGVGEVGTGCIPGEAGCPCPAGQVPRDGICVEALVDTIEALVPVDQFALAGDVIEQPPAVRVSAGGAPVPGVSVAFGAAGTPGGVLGTVEAISDANGIATAGSWTLGKLDGIYYARAAVPAAPDVTPIDFAGRTISDFEIVLHYVNPPTDAQFEAFEFARLRWQASIINALAPVNGDLGNLAAECGVPFEGGNVSITGVHIFVQLQEIDGPGGPNGNILGQAGPCSIRDDLSPYLGVMTFDTFDLDELQASGSLETVILHEMGHVLGVGSLWGLAGLLREPSIPDSAGVDTHFVGTRATEIFLDLLGAQPFPGNIVPVENNAQPGSSDSHWREDVVVDELMSPRLGGPGEVAPMSVLTIGSMGDLGFFVPNELAADVWVLPPQALVGPGDEAAALGTDTVLEPRWRRNAAGELTPLP